MNTHEPSNPRVAGTHTTTVDSPAPRRQSPWSAESWDLTPKDTTSAVSDHRAAVTGPHARPVVVMLGLFTITGSTVSAVMLEGGEYVWLDLISRNGSRPTPLAVVSGVDADHPHADIEASHRYWADSPEIRWHLAHQTANLYRAYLGDRMASSRRPEPGQGSRFRPDSPACPEPRPRPVTGQRPRTTGTGTSGLEG